MKDDEKNDGRPVETPGADGAEEILACRVGRRSGRVVLGPDRLYVESDDEGFETKSFLLDESLQMQEKFGKETVSVELQQEDERVRAWKLSRKDFNRLEARVAEARDSGARPARSEERLTEEDDEEPAEGVRRHEAVASVAANLWEEITGSPGHAQKGLQVTVHAGPNEVDGGEDEEQGSPSGNLSRRRGDPLSLVLAAGLLLFVLHTFWVGLAPQRESLLRKALRGDARAVRDLTVRLASEEDLAARVAIVETLSLTGGPEVRSALVHGLLRRDEPYYRRVTVQALTRLRVGNEIVGALSGKEPIERRRRLLDDLSGYGGPQVIPALQTVYASAAVEEALKGNVALALARLGEGAALAGRIQDDRPAIAGEAFRLALTLEEPRRGTLLEGLRRPLPVAAVEAQVATWLARRSDETGDR